MFDKDNKEAVQTENQDILELTTPEEKKGVKLPKLKEPKVPKEKKVKDFEELKAFDRLDYCFDEQRSSEKEYVFIKK